MPPKCAWCNSDKLCTVERPPAAWCYRKCGECGGMNRFRPIDQWEGDSKTTIIVTEMLPHGQTAGSEDPPWYMRESGGPRAKDADVGRAIEAIIKEQEQEREGPNERP